MKCMRSYPTCVDLSFYSDTAMLLTSSGSEEDTDMGSPIDQHQPLHRKQQAAPGGDVCAILRSPLMTDRYDSGAASANCPPWLNRGLYRPSDEYRPKYEYFSWQNKDFSMISRYISVLVKHSSTFHLTDRESGSLMFRYVVCE